MFEYQEKQNSIFEDLFDKLKHLEEENFESEPSYYVICSELIQFFIDDIIENKV